MGMGQKISAHKMNRILELYFAGNAQSQIANTLKINQSTVSLTIGKFKTVAAQYGFEAAAKEYGIMDQVKALHSLAAELKAANLTIEEAKVGLKMVIVLQGCGVKQEDYQDLVQACTKMKSEDLVKAAVELNQLENATGKTWQEIVAEGAGAHQELEQTLAQIASMTDKLNTSKEQLAAIDNDKKLADQDLAAHLKKVGAEKKQASQDLAAHMKQAGVDMNRLALVDDLAIALKEESVSDADLEQYIKRQKYLNQVGISLDNFITIAKLAKVMTADDGGKALAEKLSQFGSLDVAIEARQNKLSLLKEETAGLEEIAGLRTSRKGGSHGCLLPALRRALGYRLCQPRNESPRTD